MFPPLPAGRPSYTPSTAHPLKGMRPILFLATTPPFARPARHSTKRTHYPTSLAPVLSSTVTMIGPLRASVRRERNDHCAAWSFWVTHSKDRQAPFPSTTI